MRGSGDGLAPWPTKPVTPGVLRMTYQRVVVEVAAHEQVAGEDLLLDDDLLAVLELDDVFHRDDDLVDRSSMFMDGMRASRFCLTFFS